MLLQSKLTRTPTAKGVKISFPKGWQEINRGECESKESPSWHNLNKIIDLKCLSPKQKDSTYVILGERVHYKEYSKCFKEKVL